MYRHLYSGLRTGHEQNRYEWRRSLPEVGEDWVLEVMTSRRHVINCQWQGPHTPLAETARQRGRHCQRSDACKSTPRSLQQRGVTGLRGCGQYSGTGGCKESKGFFFFGGGGDRLVNRAIMGKSSGCKTWHGWRRASQCDAAAEQEAGQLPASHPCERPGAQMTLDVCGSG